jgi:hypothetical protein
MEKTMSRVHICKCGGWEHRACSMSPSPDSNQTMCKRHRVAQKVLSFVLASDRAQRSEIHRKSAQTVQAAHQYTRACALRACMCVSKQARHTQPPASCLAQRPFTTQAGSHERRRVRAYAHESLVGLERACVHARTVRGRAWPTWFAMSECLWNSASLRGKGQVASGIRMGARKAARVRASSSTCVLERASSSAAARSL